MKHPFIQLLLMHLRDFLREPGSVFWSFGFPILMAIGLGLAFSGEKEIMHGVAIIPSNKITDTVTRNIFFDGALAYDTVIEKKFETGYSKTRYVFHITSWYNAELLLKRGIVASIISEKQNNLIFHSDPLNPESELINIQLSHFFKTGELKTFDGTIEPLESKGLRYIDFLVPGLLAMSIMMSVMWGVCYALIEKRSKKLLRRMVATPMKKSHFLIAQWLSRNIITLFETFVLLCFAIFFFKLSIQGSIIALFLILIAGNFCFFGISILISSKTANMHLGNGIISIITTPMILLSGIFFNYNNFPSWAIPVIKVLPLTKFADETRSIINEGAGLLQTYDGILILSGLGLLSFFIGLRIYKWS